MNLQKEIRECLKFHSPLYSNEISKILWSKGFEKVTTFEVGNTCKIMNDIVKDTSRRTGHKISWRIVQ